MSIVAYGFGIDANSRGVGRVVRNATIELNQTAPMVNLESRELELMLTPANNLILLSNENVAFLEEGANIAAGIRSFDLVLTNRSYS